MLTTDQLFELNLPPFSEIILPTFKGFDDDHLTTNYLTLYNLNEIIKPKYLGIADLEWNFMNYFKKSNYKGAIHTDSLLPNNIKFAINWVTDGDGILEFWNESVLHKIGSTTGAFNEPTSGVVPKFYASVPPDKSYVMKKNSAYLVNATTPHRAIGFANRKCYSMRTSDTHILWDDVIKLFDQYIIK